jgi:hypothetical protein
MELVDKNKPPGGDGVGKLRYDQHALLIEVVGSAVKEFVGVLGVAERGFKGAEQGVPT